jgi:hypothetical protein
MFRRALLRTPPKIVNRLRRRGSLSIHVPIGANVWDPAKPYPAQLRGAPHMGPGRAVYTLESETVHVMFRSWFGEHLDTRGPIPEQILHPTPETLRHRTQMRRIAFSYVGLVVVAFLLGFFLSPGAPLNRLGWGVLIALLAMALFAVLGHGTLVLKAFGTLAKGTNTRERVRHRD